MTECTPSSLGFEAHFSRAVVARFAGGTMSSDSGALLLRETNRRLKLLSRLAACFADRRQPGLIFHSVEEMVSQRVYGLALGYEDLNGHDQLREDPLLGLLSGRRRVNEEPLAGYREEHLFVLRQSLKSYRHYQEMIQEVDLQVKQIMQRLPSKVHAGEKPPKEKHPRKTPWRNEPPQLWDDLYRAFGMDLTQVPGINTLTQLPQLWPAVDFFGLLGERISDKPNRRSFVFIVRRQPTGGSAPQSGV